MNGGALFPLVDQKRDKEKRKEETREWCVHALGFMEETRRKGRQVVALLTV